MSPPTRAVVTGGAGFVGSHLVDRLVLEGWEVLVLDNLVSGKLSNLADVRHRGSVEIHQIDISSAKMREVLVRFRPDTLFHLAAQTSVAASVADVAQDAHINILGSINLLQAAQVAQTRRVVFVSTGGAVYGSGARLPAKESQPRLPESPYGISKLAVEGYLRFWKKTHGLDYVVLGPANIYGPRQDPTGEAGVVAIFARACLDRKPPTIFGSGEDTRDYVYVGDVVEAMMRAVTMGKSRFYNIGTGQETSTNELYEMVAQQARFRGNPFYGPPRAGDLPRSSLNPALAGKDLGWAPFTSLRQGLAQTVNWFAHNP